MFFLFKVQHMLHLFIFPQSRVQFLVLLSQAGVLSELESGLGIQSESTEIDFWSYVNELEDEDKLCSVLDR